MTDPAELNILVSSTERCGVSWFCLLISLLYEKMYGKVVKWNYRISRLLAGSKDYPIMDGWSTCQWVPLKKIEQKNYDKIILLQRSFESLCKSMFIYYFWTKDYEKEAYKAEYDEWFESIDSYYNQIYPKTESPKTFRVFLEHVNSYTVLTLNLIMDFLEFKKENRPLIVPVNPPERVWEVFSCVLPTGEKIARRLEHIYKKYDNIELEYSRQKNETMINSASIVNTINFLTPEEINTHGKRIFTLNPNLETKIPDLLLDKNN